MNRIKPLLIALIIVFSTLSLAAAPRFGERPFIDIYQVPDSAIEPGHIRIKLSEARSPQVQAFRYENDSLASFGIAELDELTQQFGITKITPVFGDVSRNNKWGWRHIEWGLHLWFDLQVDSRANIRDIVMAYRAKAGSVQWAEPVYEKVLYGASDDLAKNLIEAGQLSRWTPNDPRYDEQWHYNNTGQTGGTVDADIDLPEAWDLEAGNAEVVVAVEDQGIQFNHPDLAANMWINSGEVAGNGIDDDGNGYVDDIYGYNFTSGTGTISPGDHGTHTSGTIGAVTNNGVGVSGIAGGTGSGNGVRLMSTQVFLGSSGGSGFETAPVYGADNGACISQNSWGYTSAGYYEQSVLDGIDYFNANGGGVVLDGGITIYAAGNSYGTGDYYPGCYSGSFAVASTDHNDQKVDYSNYGAWVDVSAPGGDTDSAEEQGVLSTVTGNSYDFYQGTSMACPHTSGVAALVVSFAYRNGRVLSNAELADLIRDSADDHYGVNQGYLGMLGTGRINAYQAILAADPTLPSLSITEPANGAVIDLNSIITVNATATDTDGYITGVAFYLDDALQTTDTSSPYSWVWDTNGLPGGTHTIRAAATDNDDNSVSRSITITLLAPPDEGFESGDFTLFPWENSSSVPWSVQASEKFSGTYSAKSGDIGGSSSTTLSLPVVISSADNVSFWYKVSSESGWDYLRFYIDNVQQGEWSGSAGWSEASYTMSSGPHTLKWTYSKDGSGDTGSDCAWLDHIIFPPMGIYYAPPRNLVATSGNAFVDLEWQAPASGSPTSYKIHRDGSFLASTGDLTYTDTNVINDTNYQYYVTAIYDTEESDPSNTVSAFPTANPAIEITIGNGTSTQSYPIDRYYNYSSHEAIYLSTEIGTAGTIKSIAFHKASGSDVGTIEAVTIYMKNTTASTLATGTYSTTGYTQVYSGNWPNTSTSGWMEVNLNTLFPYDGTNLSILTIKGNQAYITNYPYWSYTNSSTTRARQARSDTSQPTSLTASNNQPNLMLRLFPMSAELYPAQNLLAEAGNGFVALSWDAPYFGIPSGYQIFRDGSLLTTVTGLTYTDSAVVNETTYSYYVVAVYNGEAADPSNTVQATPTSNLPVEATLGTGSFSSGVATPCPVNINFQSLHGQSVYTAAELNAAGVFGPVQIMKIGFNVTGIPTLSMPNYVIRMGHTTAINGASWIPAANLTQVWSSTSYRPTETGWNLLTLATPFTWNGTDNIVVDTAFGLIGSTHASGQTQYTSVTTGYRTAVSNAADMTNVFSGGTSVSYRPNLRIAYMSEALAAPAVTIATSETAGVTVSWPAVPNAGQYQILRALEPFGTYEHLAYTEDLSYNDTEANDMAFYKVKALSAPLAK